MVVDVEFEVPSCNQVFQMLFCQAEKVRLSGFGVDVVVGVARGGVVSARFLADFLGVDAFGVVQVGFYVGIGEAGGAPVLRGGLSVDVVGKSVLLVDDIADSGRTLEFVSAYVLGLGALAVKTATLYYKPQSAFKPDFYEKQTRCWVVFPWELKETLRKITSAQGGRRQAKGKIAKLVKAGLPKALADKLIEDLR
jgi:hypoxanthine phosphoribosyltransferase